MRYTGRLIWWEAGEEAECAVSAAIRDNRISLDWTEEGWPAHLDATSQEGSRFKGYYGYPTADDSYEYQLRKYTSGRDVLLFGSWSDHTTGDEGKWVFLLAPDEAQAT